ncbi:MAG TPA: hypothetical protein VM940_09145 [Chthoniobacterales bacterium]|nr:hypothetical protein [Chthoniobacterales bacterium]
MSASKTNFVLRLLGEIEVADSHAIGARLDPETTVAFFSADRDRSWSNRLDLPVHWRVRIWRQRLEREINFVEMNNVLENALLDLPEQEHADIIRRTISQFSPKSPLYKWFSFFEKHPQWKAQVSTFLQECARAGGASGGVESALGYLAFGNDPGGQSLATRGLDRHAATLFVDRLNQEARRESSNLMEAARAWLDAMAASEFRLYVELKSKLILARGSALSRQRSRNWRWLWRLEQLYLGRKVRFLLTSMPISERHFLRHEFAEMVSEPLGKEVPLLAQVAQLLDGIPQKLVARLSKLSVGTGQIEAWDYQLRQSGLPEAAESFLAHVTLRGLDDGMRRRAFSKVDESTLIVELTRLLRELPETETPMGAKRFADFLQGTRDERLREKMGAVIRGTWKSANEDDSRSRDSMLTGLARDPALFLEFTAGFDEGEQITLLGRLEQMAPQAMRVESVRAARLLDHGKPVDRGTTALLRFMHNPAGEQLRTIAGRDAFRGGVRAFDRQLCGLFGARRATPVRKSETRLGIFKKMFDRFQRRPAR